MRRPATWLVAMAGLVTLHAWAFLHLFRITLRPRFILQPWLMSRGWVPYEDLADMHTPFLPLLLSLLLRVQPDAAAAARGLLACLLALSAFLTFLAARRLGAPWGVWAMVFFLLWSPRFQFNVLWYESVLTPLYLIFLLAGLSPRAESSPVSRQRWRLAALGILGGIAVMVKQQAAAVLAAFALWNALAGRPPEKRSAGAIARETAILIGGSLLPVALYIVWHLARGGSLANFLYWTAAFPLMSGYAASAARAPSSKVLWLMIAAGLLLPAALFHLIRGRLNAGRRAELAWALLLVAASALPAWPRFELYHLQAALPPTAFVTAAVLAFWTRHQASPRRLALAGAICLSLLWLWACAGAWLPLLHRNGPHQVTVADDLVSLSGRLKQRVKAGDRILVFPETESTSNLYYFLGQPPPAFWSYSFRWFMTPAVSRRLLEELRARPPEWVVWFPAGSGLYDDDAEPAGWIQANYRIETTIPWKGARKVRLLRLVPPTPEMTRLQTQVN